MRHGHATFPARRVTGRLAAGVVGVLLVATPGLAAAAGPAEGTPTASGADGSVGVRMGAPVVAVDDGRPARVPVTLVADHPLAGAVGFHYRTAPGTARPGQDYAPVAGTVTFPAGARPGATRFVTVPTMRTTGGELAESFTLHLAGGGGAPAPAATVVVNAHGLPYLDRRAPIAARVHDLLGRMSLPEKIGQMTQAERAAVVGDPSQITTLRLGSLLSGGGSVPTPNTPTAWADMVDRFQTYALATPLQVPLLYGVDAVHGHGNLYGATVFPHNIGLGATRDPRLVEQVEHITATETRASGPQWVFAPCICAARDDRWGRTYESFGEDPALVTAMLAGVDGFQGRDARQLSHPDRVLATAKHYAGDGDTRYGTGEGDYPIDQGVTVTNRADFARIDLAQYAAAVRGHDVGSVMPSFSSVDWTEDGVGNPVKMHANHELITDVLKGRMGFDGFVISDWAGIHQIPGDWATQVRTSVNAGIDMFMEPYSAAQFESTLLDEVNAGRVPVSRVDDAVRRILTAKFELGLFEHPFTDRRHLDSIGSPAHRAVARRAVAESAVLLTNRDHALPLPRQSDIYVAGANADDIGNQAGGWTITWQGESGDIIPGTTILDGIREVTPHATVTYSRDASAPVGGADVGVVVVGETPYAEGFGDVGGPLWAWDPADQGVPRPEKTMRLSEDDAQAVDTVCTQTDTCVVVVVSGRPLVIPPSLLAHIDGLVAAWLPGSEGAGVADVLFGARPFTGRLPVSWPRSVEQEPINVGDAGYDPLFPYGWGLRTAAGRPSAAGLPRAAAVAR